MGILDEAIRDHLELKRQHGAESDELKRLEDEAFGPPTRPGEPDFPESAEAQASNGDLEPTTVEEEAAGEQPDETAATAAPEWDAGALEQASAADDAAEHPVLTDPSEAETTLYDQALDEDLDLTDLGVAPEEEAGEAEPGEPQPDAEAAPAADPAEPAAPASEEPPIESLETVEHPLEPASDELEAAPGPDRVDQPPPDEPAHDPPSQELGDDPPAGGEEATAKGEPESSEEDVLADTPDFLRDAPEDDELWFEQGEPKDFDFD
jgi:hypothetical protein